jgi:hypothetical protein
VVDLKTSFAYAVGYTEGLEVINRCPLETTKGRFCDIRHIWYNVIMKKILFLLPIGILLLALTGCCIGGVCF